MSRLLLVFASLFVCALTLLTILSDKPQARKQAELDRYSQVRPDAPWFQEKVLDGQTPVLVKFGATWCGPCKMLDQTLTEIHEKYGDRLEIVKIDIDQQPELARQYELGPIPLVLVYHSGRVVAAEAGMVWYEGIDSLVKPYVKTVPSSSTKVPDSPPAAPPVSAVPVVDARNL